MHLIYTGYALTDLHIFIIIYRQYLSSKKSALRGTSLEDGLFSFVLNELVGQELQDDVLKVQKAPI